MNLLRALGDGLLVGSFVVAGVATAPLWIWIPIGQSLVDVFAKPPEGYSTTLLSWTKRRYDRNVYFSCYKSYVAKKVKQVQEALPGYDPQQYNVAICGESRTGKSSLVNAILGIRDNNRNAAPVGVVETTHIPSKYQSPDILPYLTVWDMPGAGTDTHQTDKYYEEKKLFACDTIILVTKDTVKEVDVHIFKQAHELGQEVAVVRTHAEVAIRNLMRGEGISAELAALKLKQAVHQNLNDHWHKMQVPPSPVYIVDRWAFAEEDFYNKNGISLSTPNGYLDEVKLLQFLTRLQDKREKLED